MSRKLLADALDKAGLGLMNDAKTEVYLHARPGDNMLSEVEAFARSIAVECIHVIRTSSSQYEAEQRIKALFELIG